jgi:hypothetical protein
MLIRLNNVQAILDTALNKDIPRCATLIFSNLEHIVDKIAPPPLSTQPNLQPTCYGGTNAARELNFWYTTIIEPILK